MTVRLRPGGKPFRALQALAKADRPLTETDVWVSASPEVVLTSVNFTDALQSLVKRGLAANAGFSSRGYRPLWVITDAGREYLLEHTEARA